MSEEATLTLEAESTSAVSATVNGYSVTLHNLRGKCVITWSNPNAIILQKEAVWLYQGSAPANPPSAIGIWVNGQSGSYDTGQPWGPGWSAGLAAQTWPSGAFAYLAKTPVTT